jgi:hypothetical protein
MLSSLRIRNSTGRRASAPERGMPARDSPVGEYSLDGDLGASPPPAPASSADPGSIALPTGCTSLAVIRG